MLLNVYTCINCLNYKLRSCIFGLNVWPLVLSCVILLSLRLSCYCHVQHLHPKQTKDSAHWRHFCTFQPLGHRNCQWLSSETHRGPPRPHSVHSDSTLIQQHFPLSGLAILSVKFRCTLTNLVLVLILHVETVKVFFNTVFFFKGSNVYLTIKRPFLNAATCNRIKKWPQALTGELKSIHFE